MKAFVYHGPKNVHTDDKPRGNIQNPEEVVLHVTSTAMCGSDLHLYHGNFGKGGHATKSSIIKMSRNSF
jgi:threonine dehydrogenase-like Zn-dependent dehydrogenase